MGRQPALALALPVSALCLGVAAFVLAPLALDLAPAERLLLTGIAIAALPTALLVWRADPAWVFTGALVLSPLSSNWDGVGVPGVLAPDRLLLIAGIVMVIARAPAIRDRPPLSFSGVHGVLALALGYAIVSAAIAGSLTEREPFFRLLEAYGVLPFAVFAFAPYAFRTESQRRVLLWGLIGLGAYLGFTALAEGFNLDALVFPRYILDPSFGIHADYARGPFVEASTNGLALVACAAAGVIGALRFESPGQRVLCALVVVMCVPGAFLTMERSVWLGTALAGLAALLVLPRLRRIVIPALLVAAVLVGGILVASPTLREQSTDRLNNSASVYDRYNMNNAALAMARERPLLGFGWGGYERNRFDYFEQNPEYPMTGATKNTLVHNVLLNNLAELGVIGTGIWFAGLAMMVWAGVRARSRLPDVKLWSAMLIAVTIMAFVVLFFTPIKPFAILILCFWAAAIRGGVLEEREWAGLPAPARPRGVAPPWPLLRPGFAQAEPTPSPRGA